MRPGCRPRVRRGPRRVRFRALLPWRTLDRTLMDDGSEMTLARRGDEHSIRIDGDVLMTSKSHGSEEKLAERGCAGLDALPRARVLIGGLGMGFTARAALAVLRPDAVVDVVELVGAVVRWNRELIGHLADAPLLNPRVRVIEGDVADVIGRARALRRDPAGRRQRPRGVHRAGEPAPLLARGAAARASGFAAQRRPRHLVDLRVARLHRAPPRGRPRDAPRACARQSPLEGPALALAGAALSRLSA